MLARSFVLVNVRAWSMAVSLRLAVGRELVQVVPEVGAPVHVVDEVVEGVDAVHRLPELLRGDQPLERRPGPGQREVLTASSAPATRSARPSPVDALRVPRSSPATSPPSARRSRAASATIGVATSRGACWPARIPRSSARGTPVPSSRRPRIQRLEQVLLPVVLVGDDEGLVHGQPRGWLLSGGDCSDPPRTARTVRSASTIASCRWPAGRASDPVAPRVDLLDVFPVDRRLRRLRRLRVPPRW